MVTLTRVALAEPSIAVTGDLPKPVTMTLAALEALGPVKATWSEHGATHEVYGVALDKVLAKAGFAKGEMGKDVPVKEKRSGWKKCCA